MKRSTVWVAVLLTAFLGWVLGDASPASSVTLSTVTGTVSSSNGQVSSGSVSFYATCADYENGDEAGYGEFDSGDPYTVTVPNGTYRVRILPFYGNDAVRSWHSAKTSCADADVVTVTGNTTADLTALAGFNVTGTVSSSNGPVSGGNVFFYATCADYENGEDDAADVHFDNGQPYTVTVPNGTYRVRINPRYRDEGAVASWHSAKTSCADADVVTVTGNTTANLTALAGAKVTGNVSSSNGTVQKGEVDFYATCADYENGDAADYDYFDGGDLYTVFVPKGTYRVRIDPYSEDGAVRSWHSAKTSCADADVVTVTGDTTADLTALAGFNVTGTVSSSNGPVFSGHVSFYATCADYENGDEAAYTWFDNLQPYRVTIANGTYRVQINPNPGTGALDSWHAAKTTCTDANVVTVTGNTTADLTALPGSNVTGTVSSSNGTVQQGEVEFYATCTDFENGDAAGLAYFDGGDPYTVTVPNGTYRVQVEIDNNNGDELRTSWHRGQEDCGSATTVVVQGATSLDLYGLLPGESPIPTPTPTPTATPKPTATPTPTSSATPKPGAQTVKAVPSKAKRGKKVRLPRFTAQGNRITWSVSSKRTCVLKAGKVKGKKKGICSLKASAPASAGYVQFAERFKVRIR